MLADTQSLTVKFKLTGNIFFTAENVFVDKAFYLQDIQAISVSCHMTKGTMKYVCVLNNLGYRILSSRENPLFY